MPIIKSTLQAAQNYADYSKLTKGKPAHVATLVHGDNEVSQKQLEKLKTLKVFNQQIETGALELVSAKGKADQRTELEKRADEEAEAEAARKQLAEAEAKEKAEAEAQKLLDDAAALANGGK